VSDKVQVYAVVRLDDYQETDDPRLTVTVKEILPTLEEAEAEVARLNKLNEQKHCRYFCQTTRFFPHGRRASPGDDA
jgi:hypothetical protein